MAYPHHHHQGPKFSWVCGILLLVHPYVCTGSLTPAWTDMWQVKLQARRRWQSPGMTGASSFSMTWSICAPWPPFLPMLISLSLLNCTPILVGLAWGLSSTRLMMQWNHTIIAYASRSLTKIETQYPTHKLEFLALKWAMVEKFHKYLYGSTFSVYTDNNPLMHVLTVAKLDAMSHCWEASLANYNFQLYYRGREDYHWCICLIEGVLAQMCAKYFRHTPPSHCSGNASHAGGHPQRPHEPHWGIQLWPAHPGPGRGWSTGHLHDHKWLASGPAGQTLSWASWLWGFRMGPWAIAH